MTWWSLSSAGTTLGGERKGEHVSDAHAWRGTLAAFRAVGFVEVARRSASLPIMRYEFTDAE